MTKLLPTSYRDAAILASKRVGSSFWRERISDMLRHVCLLPSRDGSTAMPIYLVKIDRVSKNWPRRGAIHVTRNDGIKFRLIMQGRAFKIEQCDLP